MKTFVFDLDGTLATSKEAIDDEMVSLLIKLLDVHNVAIMSGASWKQLQKQVSDKLDSYVKNSTEIEDLSSLTLLPSSGASMYRTWGKYGWVAVYQEKLIRTQISKIHKAIESSISEVGFEIPDKLWGKQIEDREGQVTFSALGQRAPTEAKESWDTNFSKRKPLFEAIKAKLGGAFDIHMSGSTSIDVSAKGVNKKFGIEELMQRTSVSKDDITYIGDAIFKGGKDFVAIEMGLSHHEVKDFEETKQYIRGLLEAPGASTSVEKTA